MHPGFDMHAARGSELLSSIALRYHVQVSPPRAAQVKDFKSTLKVVKDGEVVKEKTIEVNAPLSYGGYTFYQSGYNPEDHKWTSLQVVKDPGVPIVYTGFAFMILGMALIFYMQPSPGRSSGEKIAASTARGSDLAPGESVDAPAGSENGGIDTGGTSASTFEDRAGNTTSKGDSV